MKHDGSYTFIKTKIIYWNNYNEISFVCSKKGYGSKWTWETFQLHDWTQIEVEQLTQSTVEILIKMKIKIEDT